MLKMAVRHASDSMRAVLDPLSAFSRDHGRKHPGRVHAVRMQCVRNAPSLGARRAVTDAECAAEVGHNHVRLGPLDGQEVDLSQYVDSSEVPPPEAWRPASQKSFSLIQIRLGGHGVL